MYTDIFPWTLSAPPSSQFSSSFALEKLFASSSWTDKVCEQISVRFLAPNRSYCLFSSKFSISLIKLYFIEKQIIFFFPFCSSLEEDASFFCFVVAGIDWNRTVIYASFQWSTRARCDIIFRLKRKKVSSKSRPMIRNTRSQLWPLEFI